MNGNTMEISEIVTLYAETRDVSNGYIQQLKWFAHALQKTGARVAADLTAEGINHHLRICRDTGISTETRRSRRRMALTLADFAADRGLIEPVARRRVMKIGRRDRLPRAWTINEVRQLLLAAEAMKGTYQNGVDRAAYWSSYVRAAWDTGLRGVDLRTIEREQVPDHGTLLIVQHKTGKRVRIHFRPSTLAAIDRTFPPRRALIWPLWGRLECWRREAKRLVRLAGLTGGIGHLRHSCGTAVELNNPGRGHERLGNTRQIFERHYLDETKIGIKNALLPQEL